MGAKLANHWSMALVIRFFIFLILICTLSFSAMASTSRPNRCANVVRGDSQRSGTQRLSDDLWNLIKQANSAFARHRYEDAIEVLRLIIDANPKDFRALSQMGAAHLRIGKPEEAVGYFLRVMHIEGQTVKNLANLSNAYLAAARPYEALETVDLLLDIKPKDIIAYAMKAKALLALDRPREALTTLNQSLKLSPNDVIALTMKAKIQLSLGLFKPALATAEHRLRLEPNDVKAISFKANTQLLLGHPKEALMTLERGLRLDPEDVVALTMKAKTLLALGRAEEALDVIEQDLSSNQQNVTAQGMRVKALLLLGRSQEALSAVSQLEEGFYKTFYLASVQVMLGDHSSAIENFKTLPQDHLSVLWRLSHAYYMAGDMVQSYATLVQIIQRSPHVDKHVLAAIMKIETAEGGSVRNPAIAKLIADVGIAEVTETLVLKDHLFWSYTPSQEAENDDGVSLANPFWSSVNNQPVNYWTWQTTK